MFLLSCCVLFCSSYLPSSCFILPNPFYMSHLILVPFSRLLFSLFVPISSFSSTRVCCKWPLLSKRDQLIFRNLKHLGESVVQRHHVPDITLIIPYTHTISSVSSHVSRPVLRLSIYSCVLVGFFPLLRWHVISFYLHPCVMPVCHLHSGLEVLLFIQVYFSLLTYSSKVCFYFFFILFSVIFSSFSCCSK